MKANLTLWVKIPYGNLPSKCWNERLDFCHSELNEWWHDPFVICRNCWKEGRVFILWCTQHILIMVIWLQSYGTVPFREETRCHHFMDHSFQSAARVHLYTSSNKQESHGLYYTSCGVSAGIRNSSMGPPWGIDLMTNRTISG